MRPNNPYVDLFRRYVVPQWRRTAVLGVLILATLPLVARKRKPQAPSMLAAGSEDAGMLEQGVGKAMQQVGPVTLLAIAFIAGLLASRRE